jgi:L-histidine Nalpha-methyltransferase
MNPRLSANPTPPATRRERLAETEDLAAEVRGTFRGQLPSLPAKLFYDARGSELFEEITTLPEYYQTRTEEGILARIAPEVARQARARELVELGSGVGRKVRLLLDALAGERLESCTLFDINGDDVARSVRELAGAYPSLRVGGIVGDFLHGLGALGSREGRLLLFLGSTIGNIHPDETPAFLREAANTLEPEDGWFLVGLDLVKDVARLEAAYNDAQGVTAEFNRNMLRVVNARLGADFDPEAFAHVAFYDPARAWIEMRLRARWPSVVRIPRSGIRRLFRPGDEIRTEISCKYTRESWLRLLQRTDLALDAWFTDPEGLFAVALHRRLATPHAG